MENKILYQQHIMWYESKLVNQIFDSLYMAIQNSQIPVQLELCVNLQTYLETPEKELPEEMVLEFMSHEVLTNAHITYKTNNDGFYNIGDWRREIYEKTYKYTVWGESDCIIPTDYFYILSQLNIDHPHIVSLASRKMWDNTWDAVEHEYLQQFARTHITPYTAPYPFNAEDNITLEELDEFNGQFEPIKIIKLNKLKVDGALLALSGGLPTPFIPNDMHFVREDTCAELFFNLNGIPQYLIKNRIKGHNYHHPLKRTNTKNTRNDDIFKQYASQSEMAMRTFLESEFNKLNRQ